MATPGAFLEIVNLDPQTQQADGSTSIVQITTVRPLDASGAYCELEFLGSSWPARAQALMMFSHGGAVLHLCAGVCHVSQGGRLVLHVTVARLRQPQDLNEARISSASHESISRQGWRGGARPLSTAWTSACPAGRERRSQGQDWRWGCRS